jgi:1-acyl-sn-glycerol-3-phosphate acyltransferase
MSEHSIQNFAEQAANNQKIVFLQKKSNTTRLPWIAGKLWSWWAMFAAGSMVFFVASPALLICYFTKDYGWFKRLAMFGASTWLRLCGAEVIIRGLENLKPEETYVFISNHRSYLDTAIVESRLGRHVGIVAKAELLKVPIWGYGMGFADLMAIDRSNPERAIETMREAATRIQEGLSVVVFAEGTRALPDELLPFKKGAFHLAIEAGAPVVPIAIKNSGKLMGKKTGVAQPGTIEVVLLPPISTAGLSRKNDLENLRDRVRSAIAQELSKQ